MGRIPSLDLLATTMPAPPEEPSLCKVQQDLESKASRRPAEQSAPAEHHFGTAWGDRRCRGLSPVGIYETAPDCFKSKIVPGTQLEVCEFECNPNGFPAQSNRFIR